MDGAAYDLLQKAKCRLIMKEPFYGTCAMMFDFREEAKSPSMGVRIVSNGVVSCGYNPDFLKSLSLEQTYALIIHECEHIIRLHPLREEARMHDAYNVATDFAINGPKSNPTCAYREEGRKPIPPTDDGCFVPEDWPKNENAETYYDMLPKCNTCQNVLPWDPKTGEAAGKDKGSGDGEKDEGKNKKKGKGKGKGKDKQKSNQPGGSGQGQGQGQGIETCPGCGRPILPKGDYRDGDGNGGKLVDDHGSWNDSDVSEDEARQIVKQIVDQAASNAQGNVPGHLKEFIDQLAKPVVRWREIVRRFLGRHAGGCRRTFSRRNRRYDVFGLKGTSHHAVATLGVIVDTSGSIGSEELEQFFAEIESIGSRTKTWVLQFDAAFGDFHKRYRRGDWKKIEIKHRGGTRMDFAQEWVIENKIPADAVIMLTDGITPWKKDAMPMPFFVCLTRENDVPDYAEKIVMPAMK